MKKPWLIGKNSLFVLLTTVILIPSQGSAQTLNQQINSLLANNCEGLGTGGFNNFNGAGLGPNLLQVCGPPQSFGSVSSGGGAASVQGSAVSILNQALLNRLEDVKREGREDGQKASSMIFNPLALLPMANMRNLDIRSPFYAASTAMDSSSSGFMTSSPSRWNGLGFFATGRVESLNRVITTFQDGYKSSILGMLVGMDYRFSKSFVAGIVGNYSNTDGDFRGGGTFSTNSYGGLAFAQILPTERTFIYLTGGYARNKYLVNRQATATLTDVSVDGTRTFNSFASSNSNGDVANASVLAGYDYPIGRFVIGPRVGAYYTRTRIGEHQENGGEGIALAYDAQDIDSLQGTAGLFGSVAYSTGFGVLVHQVSADYVHEFMNHQRQINVRFAEDLRTNPTRFAFQNEKPARDYANLSTGLVMVLRNGWQPFVNFRAMVGNEQFTNYAGTAGLRISL